MASPSNWLHLHYDVVSVLKGYFQRGESQVRPVRQRLDCKGDEDEKTSMPKVSCSSPQQVTIEIDLDCFFLQ